MKLEDILIADDILSSVNNNFNELETLIPEIKYMVGFPQNHPHHHLDVWNHTLLALSISKNNFDVRLSLLLHDIGKPFSYQDEEIRHFHFHAEKSSEMTLEILNRLGYTEEYQKEISNLVKYHDTSITKDMLKENYEFCLKLYQIQTCDALAHHPDYLDKRIKYLEETKEKMKQYRK